MDERSNAYLEAALQREWITPDQAAEARRIAETVAEVGIQQKIEDILVKKGFLTPERARKLSRELSKQKVGKYQILEKLGAGGAGIVYKANQEPLERVVAIKVLSSERTLSKRYLERFVREARIAVTLNHQNIVRGLDYGEADGYHYFVMEYVKGESLFHVLEREGTLAEKRALQIALQVVFALEHAAKYHLVHRDIKPENILITPEQVVKVCDLGLAKPSLVETAKASQDGTTIGTPTYMSPEQIRGKDDADFRSDVYSLGATLYHMVTGRPPFAGESADIVVRKHLREAVVDPRELNVGLSSSTAAIVLKMLAKKPDERYPSLATLREDLEAVLDGRPPRNTIELGVKRPTGAVHVDLDEGAHRRTRIVEGRRRSKTPLFVGLTVLVLGAALVVVVNPFGKKEPVSPEAPEKTGPVAPREPTEEEKAEEEYRLAVDWCEKNAAAGIDKLMARYNSVVKRYPESRWALHAKERITELETRREEKIRRHREEAERHYEQTLERAKALAAEKRYGAAIEELGTYPEGYEDTDYPDLLKKDEARFRADADRELEAALEKADYESSAGRHQEAVTLLEPFLAYGITEIETAARARIDKIREQKEREMAARERGRTAFRAALGEAFLKASRGEWSEARNHLVDAQGQSELVYYQDDLTKADASLREGGRFEEAMRKGAAELVGKVERFQVLGEGRDQVAGKILDVTDSGLRMTKTGGSREVSFAELAPEERVRLAFLALDNDAVADHRAAAIYLVIHAQFKAADSEIEAARILGADAGKLNATKGLFLEFLKDHSERFVRKALLRMTQDRWQEAYEQLEQAISRAPWYGRPHFLRGQVLVRLEKPQEAIGALDRSLELGEEDPEVHYWRGEAWLKQDKAQKALEAYTKYADLVKDGEKLEMVRTRINELRSRALAERIEGLKEEAKKAQRSKEWSRAAEIYRQILELDPEDHETLYLLGKAELEDKDILSAYHAFTRYLDTNPTGRTASDARKLVRHLTRTYTEGKDTSSRLTDANQQIDAGRYEGAVTLCDMALADAPLNEPAYYARAMARYRIGERDGDQDTFAACLEDLKAVEILNPTQYLVAELRAIVYYYMKKPDDALRSAEIGMKELPERWQSYNVAGLVLKEKGRHEKAIEVLTKGIEKDPKQAVLYQNRALAWEGMGRYDKAIDDVQTALKKKPSSNQISQLNEILNRLIEARKRSE